MLQCNLPPGCGVMNCKYKHHDLLHEQVRASASVSAAATDYSSYLGIVPVVVESGETACFTYAMLDNGSEKTLYSERLPEELGVTGKVVTSFDLHPPG